MKYKHKKTGYVATKTKNGEEYAFYTAKDNEIGTTTYILAEIVENGSDWEQVVNDYTITISKLGTDKDHKTHYFTPHTHYLVGIGNDIVASLYIDTEELDEIMENGVTKLIIDL